MFKYHALLGNKVNDVRIFALHHQKRRFSLQTACQNEKPDDQILFFFIEDCKLREIFYMLMILRTKFIGPICLLLLLLQLICRHREIYLSNFIYTLEFCSKTRIIQAFSVGMNLTLTVDICEPIFGNGSRFDEPKELGNQSANSWCLI